MQYDSVNCLTLTRLSVSGPLHLCTLTTNHFRQGTPKCKRLHADALSKSRPLPVLHYWPLARPKSNHRLHRWRPRLPPVRHLRPHQCKHHQRRPRIFQWSKWAMSKPQHLAMWTTLPRRTRRNLKTTCLAVLAATARFTKARQALSPVDALCLPARTWRPRAGARPGPKRAERSKDVDAETYSPPPMWA